MSKIRVKNFGPVKGGLDTHDGWLDIKKVTIFIGNQGSGKSTLAKSISTMSWIEKALVRGDFEMPQSLHDVEKFFEYQGLINYFREDTLIEYQGEAYNIAYRPDNSGNFLTTQNPGALYKLPKIMYVPAERNFLSVLKNAFDIKGLPDTLFTFGEEYKRAQYELDYRRVKLPINDYEYYHDISVDTSYILGEDYELLLNEASSGLQSTIPLFLVSRNLSDLIASGKLQDNDNLSLNQKVKMDREISQVMRDPTLADDKKLEEVRKITNRFYSSVFMNIVEEPEQNLFPSSQQKMLHSLLECNNKTAGNKLIMTTHSPYLINYLTLCVKAHEVYKLLFEKKYKLGDPELSYVNEIVPMASAIDPEDLVIYELDEKNGSIKRLEAYNGLPSDENELNEMLGESNEQFAQLLEIQQGL